MEGNPSNAFVVPANAKSLSPSSLNVAAEPEVEISSPLHSLVPPIDPSKIDCSVEFENSVHICCVHYFESKV